MTNRQPPVTKAVPSAIDTDSVQQVVGMRKWLRLTARKHSASKRVENDAAKAAADALALMLRDSRKLG